MLPILSIISMMSLNYIKKYFIVCYLVLFLVINAVAEISLDYYFGNDEPVRSVGNILVNDCGRAATRYNCYQKCGVHHACLLGQCICFKARALSKEDENLTEEDSSVEDTAAEEFFDTDEEDALESTSNEESNNSDEELVDRSALRHHIVHFCPNLDKAGACLKKCLKRGLPAFCGKDHRCYCGHKYEHTGKDPEVDPDIVRNQFKDLYEKYFGPEPTEN